LIIQKKVFQISILIRYSFGVKYKDISDKKIKFPGPGNYDNKNYLLENKKGAIFGT